MAAGQRLCDHSAMRSRIQTVVLPSEAGELGDDIRRLFQELGRAAGAWLGGECAPTLDVFEADDALSIVMDVPGVEAEAVRVVARGDVLLIVGHKRQQAPHGEATFHLVERGFGRFARTVRLPHACDTARATARLVDGELRVTVPKVAEWRGRRIDIPVSSVSDQTP
jgi:HSP20 family protein